MNEELSFLADNKAWMMYVDGRPVTCTFGPSKAHCVFHWMAAHVAGMSPHALSACSNEQDVLRLWEKQKCDAVAIEVMVHPIS